jgi:transposase InsO family protein
VALMGEEDGASDHERWARLRFAVVGALLVAPPEPGALRAAIAALVARTWRHPVSGEPVRFGFSTVERWYYTARAGGADPLGALRSRRRGDAGRHRRFGERLRVQLRAQYQAHPSWSVQLHVDNLAVCAAADPALGPMPSYATVRRYLQANGMRRRARRRRDTPGAQAAERHLAEREVRSYELAHVNALWHADFHVGSRRVVDSKGRWHRAHLLGILDDCSRLCCHAQWYLAEDAERFVHGLSQALQKRGLPRALLTDNGGAETAAEVTEGLARLGIVHETTLPYSAYQNAKQETWWAVVEGRLLAMLEGVEPLTLEVLNDATLAWVEREYHRRVHYELRATPLERLRAGPDVARECPDAEALRRAFRAHTIRTQRRSDGTCTVLGVRFEVPSRFRHIQRLRLRYARWDLSSVDLVDPHTERPVAVLYPLDKQANAERGRRALAPVNETDTGAAAASADVGAGIAPLLEKLMAEYAATGLPPAYLPFDTEDPEP